MKIFDVYCSQIATTARRTDMSSRGMTLNCFCGEWVLHLKKREFCLWIILANNSHFSLHHWKRLERSNVDAMAKQSSNFTTLLSSTLSAIIHQLLYSRAIYPPDSFVLYRFLGVRCHASRVPAVCAYIDDFLSVAVPSVVDGVGEAIILIVMEEELLEGRKNTTKNLERFEFKFDLEHDIGPSMVEDRSIYQEYNAKIQEAAAIQYEAEMTKSQLRTEDYDAMMYEAEIKKTEAMSMKSEVEKHDAHIANEARTKLEYSMKQCLLSVLALRRRKKRIGEITENLSFKLCMRTTSKASEATLGDIECPQLKKALRNGQWYEPKETSCIVSKKNDGNKNDSCSRRVLFRPIKEVKLTSCGMNMSLGMEVD